MIDRCPKCGGDLRPTAGGYTCNFCGAFIPEQKQELREGPSQGAAFQSSPVEKANVASSVYEKNIAGVCIIRNIEGQCSGSGFIYKSSGLVITNAHVIYYDEADRPSKKLEVLVNGTLYKASVINSNRPEGDDDIALLKIESTNYFHELKVGNSERVHNGEEVIAIGNPMGEGLSITRGIISDAKRIYGSEHYIMSDVTINGGNSGGPLFNDKGEVIAICVSSRVQADNMNFFIPINHVLSTVHNWGY